MTLSNISQFGFARRSFFDEDTNDEPVRNRFERTDRRKPREDDEFEPEQRRGGRNDFSDNRKGRNNSYEERDSDFGSRRRGGFNRNDEHEEPTERRSRNSFSNRRGDDED